MKVSAVSPVLNEAPWIGFSIMAGLSNFHEFIYALDEKSDDGTRELLYHIKEKYAHEKLKILEHPHFHPHDLKAYNGAFTRCIEAATGQAAMFLHPDMICTNPEAIQTMDESAIAWYTHMTSYAGDFNTVITKGRSDKWKNIHATRFGLHYYGGYGSQNEDFYHKDITGKSYKHYGTEFSKYPFRVADSGLKINHYCEMKSYKRRLEKMKLCLKTLSPNSSDEAIEEAATQHPRVTNEASSTRFGEFKFEKTEEPIPPVITKYKDVFESFVKKGELVHG